MRANYILHRSLTVFGEFLAIIAFTELLLLGFNLWYGYWALTAVLLSVWWSCRMDEHAIRAKHRMTYNAWERELRKAA